MCRCRADGEMPHRGRRERRPPRRRPAHRPPPWRRCGSARAPSAPRSPRLPRQPLAAASRLLPDLSYLDLVRSRIGVERGLRGGVQAVSAGRPRLSTNAGPVGRRVLPPRAELPRSISSYISSRLAVMRPPPQRPSPGSTRWKRGSAPALAVFCLAPTPAPVTRKSSSRWSRRPRARAGRPSWRARPGGPAREGHGGAQHHLCRGASRGVDLHVERSVVPGDHRPGQLRRQGQPGAMAAHHAVWCWAPACRPPKYVWSAAASRESGPGDWAKATEALTRSMVPIGASFCWRVSPCACSAGGAEVR